MTKSELITIIEEGEMPASEIALLVRDELHECPFFTEDECGLAERCEPNNVIPI